MKKIALLSGIIGLYGVFVVVGQQIDLRATQTEYAIEQLKARIAVSETSTRSVGAEGTQFVGGDTYYLAGSGVSSSASTIPLSGFTIKKTGQPLQIADFGSTYIYGTLEPSNSTKKEFVSCSGVTQNSDGTANLTGCTRGLSPITPYTASTTLRSAHSGGSTFIISNSPAFYDKFVVKNNDGTISGLMVFSSTSVPKLDYNPSATTWTGLASTTFVTLGKLADTSFAGTVDASTAVKGIVQLLTGAQAASSTQYGSTGAWGVLGGNLATDTPNTSTRAGRIPMTNLLGYLDKTWMDWTATTTILASSPTTNPLVLNGIPYAFPSAQGASSTVWMNNGSGSFISVAPDFGLVAMASTSVAAGTTTLTFPARRVLKVFLMSPQPGSGNIRAKITVNGDSSAKYAYSYSDDSAGATAVTSAKEIFLHGTAQTAVMSFTLEIQNPYGYSKHISWTGMQSSSEASISMYHGVGSVATTTQITSLSFSANQTVTPLPAGTQVYVYASRE